VLLSGISDLCLWTTEEAGGPSSCSKDRGKKITAALPAPNRLGVSNEALIKDVTSVQGIRDDQLIGNGIVVGLADIVDSKMTVFQLQTLVSTLQRLGVTVP
jgi:flagellar basal body P-ring protein FlgI